MVWSDVQVVQIIGRVHRIGQKETVHVFKLMAVLTTDIHMSNLARSKSVMLSSLLTKAPDDSKFSMVY